MENQEIASVEFSPLPEEEIMVIGSPEELGFEEANPPSTAIPSSSSEIAVLTDDLRDKIIRQVEYYFSDENLPNDKFLMKYVKKDKEGFELCYMVIETIRRKDHEETCGRLCSQLLPSLVLQIHMELDNHRDEDDDERKQEKSARFGGFHFKSGFQGPEVPVAVIASFRKMKKLIQNNLFLVAALKESSQLIVSSDGKKVKRANSLPVTTEVKDSKSRTVLVENLPEDQSKENIRRIFGDAGNIKNICIRDPHTLEESTKVNKAKKVVSAKVHALVEYETVEAAEKAVATLNDEKNWRSGMRVELLLKRMGKYGMARKGWKGAAVEKNSGILTSDITVDEQSLKLNENHAETPEQEEGVHSLNERIGRKGRSQGRSRGQKQHSINGHGHGTVSSSLGFECSKLPPGPKMPDGTRGFTIGRGRPPVPS